MPVATLVKMDGDIMGGSPRSLVTLTAAIVLTGITLAGAQAQISTIGPRQLTLPPHPEVDVNIDAADSEDSLGFAQGAVSVLPDRRLCASDDMIIGRPLAGAETPKLKSAVSSRCRMTATDTSPAPILAAPPNGVTPPVTPYAIRESALHR